MTAPGGGYGDSHGGGPGPGAPGRSIYAQIDEIDTQLERARRDMERLRGRDESEAREHVLRLECVLKTLRWVRDHQDAIRAAARSTAGHKEVES